MSMLFILQLVRYGAMVFLVFLILAQNPKVDGINTLAPTTRFFSNVRNTENLLENVTWFLILIFLISTTFLASTDI